MKNKIKVITNVYFLNEIFCPKVNMVRLDDFFMFVMQEDKSASYFYKYDVHFITV